MTPTDEQKAVIECDLMRDEVLKVRAFAGTGKTATLVAYAEARPHMKFLYVAFNKGVQLEASRRFGPNVTCRTAHALAFPRFGARHQDRLRPGFKANEVKAALNLANFEDARFTIDTLQNYLVSADAKVSKRHVPPAAKIHYAQFKSPVPDFVDLANWLGRLMCSGDDARIGMPHDGYLKLYQLSGPRLDYDCILLDEAQDINPVTAAFVLNQAGLPKILVGDPHQQIYSFRGAVNSMDSIKGTHTLYLTKSFRFNPNIAAAANMVLAHFKKENKKLIGLRVKSSISRHSPQTIIARTNARIFDEAVAQIAKEKKVGFVGGLAGYRFNRILDCYHLFIARRQDIKDPHIKSFASFSAMEIYAKAVEDRELASMCKVVRHHEHKVPGFVKRVRAETVDAADADIILTTAHKAKGLEWPVVKLADDFPELVANDRIIDKTDLESDEFNLIYVSMTRAMDQLKFDNNCSIIEFIKRHRQL
jgi:F-box protein 18 (helicase)